jgi:antitoxin component HigA of HigAB toxin-antitoxin module
MELKPIRTKAEYKAALHEIEALFDVPVKRQKLTGWKCW